MIEVSKEAFDIIVKDQHSYGWDDCADYYLNISSTKIAAKRYDKYYIVKHIKI